MTKKEQEIRDKAKEYLYEALDKAVSDKNTDQTVKILAALNSFVIIDELNGIRRNIAHIR